MLKKEDDKKTNVGRRSDNGQLGEVLEAIEALASQQTTQQRENEERFVELERNRDGGVAAQLVAAKMVYDTPRKNLSEYTVMSLRMVDPFSLAITCASILNEDVQAGKVSLGEIRMEEIKRLLRSVKGNLLEKGARLAERQEEIKGEARPGWDVNE